MVSAVSAVSAVSTVLAVSCGSVDGVGPDGCVSSTVSGSGAGAQLNTSCCEVERPQGLVRVMFTACVPWRSPSGKKEMRSSLISVRIIGPEPNNSTDQAPGAGSRSLKSRVCVSPTSDSAGLANTRFRVGGPCTTIVVRVWFVPPWPLIVSTAS